MLAPWIGGVCGVSPTANAGPRGLLAFWMGGACAYSAVVVPPSGGGGGGGLHAWQQPFREHDYRRAARIRRDDDDLLELITIITPLL